MEHLANVPFRITSSTTGEEHVLVTDENGMANTASSWVPHSRNTNAGTSAKDGIWFERDSHGGAAKVNDDLGALPYDTYEIEELPCKENEGTVLAHFTITISRDILRSIWAPLTTTPSPLPFQAKSTSAKFSSTKQDRSITQSTIVPPLALGWTNSP